MPRGELRTTPILREAFLQATVFRFSGRHGEVFRHMGDEIWHSWWILNYGEILSIQWAYNEYLYCIVYTYIIYILWIWFWYLWWIYIVMGILWSMDGFTKLFRMYINGIWYNIVGCFGCVFKWDIPALGHQQILGTPMVSGVRIGETTTYQWEIFRIQQMEVRSYHFSGHIFWGYFLT